MNWAVLLAGLVVVFGRAGAQDAPVTTIGTVGNAIAGTQVVVPITAVGFDSIGAFTYTIDYDYTQLQYISGIENPSLAGTFNIGDLDMGNNSHRIVVNFFSWGCTLPDSSWVVNLTFTYLSGSPTLQWYEMGPSCEYTDIWANVLNDSPTASFYYNGRVCGALPIPAAISGPGTLCQGQQAVSYSIPALTGVSVYNWNVPPGATIISGSGTNTIVVEYSTAASSGTITVCGTNECGNGPVSSMSVTVNSLPVANAGDDQSIGYNTSTQLHAAPGGTGNFSYLWSPANLLVNPAIQEPYTLQLTSSATFYLTVTNLASQCQSTDEVLVSVTGGMLGTNPVAIPASICQGQSSQLYANAGGGSGSYTYSWTCNPPGTPAWTSTMQNPVVNPVTTTEYLLTVSDGFSTASGITTLVVNPVPTGYLEGGGTICNDGSTSTVYIQLTGTPPWSFSFTDGTTTYSVTGQMISPFVLETAVPGTYSLLSVNDQNCSGTTAGSALVEVIPLPPAPVISIQDISLKSSSDSGNQWYRNGALLEGATDQIYTPLESGLYCDLVTLNGCTSDSSNRIDFLYIGIGEDTEAMLEIMPNPATNYLTLRSKNMLEESVNICIFKSDGILTKKFDIPNTLLQIGYSVNISSLSSGLYLVSISTGERKLFKKLVVK